MKKESVDMFTPPFKVITKKGTFYTINSIRKLDDSSLSFYDKFGGLNTIDIDDISKIKQIHSSISGGGRNTAKEGNNNVR